MPIGVDTSVPPDVPNPTGQVRRADAIWHPRPEPGSPKPTTDPFELRTDLSLTSSDPTWVSFLSISVGDCPPESQPPLTGISLYPENLTSPPGAGMKSFSFWTPGCFPLNTAQLAFTLGGGQQCQDFIFSSGVTISVPLSFQTVASDLARPLHFPETPLTYDTEPHGMLLRCQYFKISPGDFDPQT